MVLFTRTLVTQADYSRVLSCVVFVCLSVCFSIWYPKYWCSQDHQIWHRNVPLRVLETLYWGQKVKSSRSRGKKQCWHGFLHSCECWFLLVHVLCMIRFMFTEQIRVASWITTRRAVSTNSRRFSHARYADLSRTQIRVHYTVHSTV